MKVVIAGASGFIGRQLTQELLDDGAKVVALTRNVEGTHKYFDSSVQVVAWDGKTALGWAQHLEDAKAVVNLAGENIGAARWTETQKQKIIESRIQSTRAILDAVAEVTQKPEVLIQGSGIGFYGDTGDRIVNEDSESGTGFLAELSEKWEGAAKEAEQYGLRVVILRTSVVLGPKGGALEKMLPPFKFFVGGPMGKGQHWFPWIHLEDQTAAIRFLIQRNDLSGPFILAAPEQVRQKQFSTALGRTLGRPSWLPVPPLAVKILLGKDAVEMLLVGQRATPHRLLEAGFQFKYPEIHSALKNVIHGT